MNKTVWPPWRKLSLRDRLKPSLEEEEEVEKDDAVKLAREKTTEPHLLRARAQDLVADSPSLSPCCNSPRDVSEGRLAMAAIEAAAPPTPLRRPAPLYRNTTPVFSRPSNIKFRWPNS